jgi:hypothetical protein
MTYFDYLQVVNSYKTFGIGLLHYIASHLIEMDPFQTGLTIDIIQLKIIHMKF